MAEELAKSTSTDADYFAAVDEFLRKQNDLRELTERRRSERFEYLADAMIAYCPEGQVPPINWFDSVHCLNISRGGFAYYSAEEPALKHLVVIFRRETDYLCLSARVLHCRPVEQGDGKRWSIGCEFLGRVDLRPEVVPQ